MTGPALTKVKNHAQVPPKFQRERVEALRRLNLQKRLMARM